MDLEITIDFIKILQSVLFNWQTIQMTVDLVTDKYTS
jgi:hypothetical protein